MLVLDDKQFYDLYTSYSKNPNSYELDQLLFDLITAKTSFKDSFLYNNEYNIFICHLIERLPSPQAATVLVQAFVNVQGQDRKFNLQQFYWFKLNARNEESYTVLRHICPSALEVICDLSLDFFRAQLFEREFEELDVYSNNNL